MRRTLAAAVIVLSPFVSDPAVSKDEPTLDDLIAEKAAGPPPYALSQWELDFLETEATLYPAAEPAFLLAEDGLRLAYREWVPAEWAGSGAIYLIVPGSTSHSLHFRFLGNALRDRGILTRVIDFRGTGLSVCRSGQECGDPAGYTDRKAIDNGAYFPGRIGDAADADQIARDLEAHVEEVRARWPEASVYLSGHSSGGGLLCRFVEYVGRDETKELRQLADGVVLLAPYVHWDYPANTPGNSRYSVVHLPTVMEVARGASHRYTVGFNLGDRPRDPWVVTKWTQEMAGAMAAYGPTSPWPHFTVPTAYVIGTREELFDIEKARQEHAKAGNPGPFVVLQDASHIGMRWRGELADFMESFALDR